MVEKLDSSNFIEKTKSGKVIIDFYAEWCGPCKMMAPFFKEVAESITDVKFVKIDVDQCRDAAAKYNITSIPTMVVLVDGLEVDRNIGFIPKPLIEKLARSN